MGRFDAKASLKGQVTIPAEVRQVIGLEAGGFIQFVVSDKGSVSVVAKKSGLNHLKGLFRKPEAPIDIDAAIDETVARRVDPARLELDP
ncbi:AbrB/MazE/SpoVT family DNA-binding domain-containing protein [Rhizobium sp. 32-5/1]|uniref:AbrB/MazE/SpoVT family DNA-binding domain-containing protein n=1 Tax=Rhizobium sp. 32-5/1 TaxID=3019602 RepID=UPI00240DE430|nr:AbrB/MazE/SpoVT family DNA-binding domain-containing protein [Rhizobium sp. 32-5/1]WEZ82792.1 AbrB/MazE/SpoVT family DNA-binding domain-containing protein [Rhizobium sp. 32-5/1]